MNDFTYYPMTISTTPILFKLPLMCPHCGSEMTPDVRRHSDIYSFVDFKKVSLLVQCVKCKEFYALAYTFTTSKSLAYTNYYESTLIPYTYTAKVNYDLPNEINEFSKEFKDIYTQAQLAESYELLHLASIGYRKALEYLIKDFLIEVRKMTYEEVANKPRSQVISKLENPLLESPAKAAAWIANDDTHYYRKHPDKTIDHVKKYIRSVAHSFTSEYLALESAAWIAENSSNKSN